ncbi:MAG TPA: hypothetical protein VNJ04_12080 [Gemmatimonadaceae bacterium]|nr:hypothetical protein [Gemmatimonadaceae bacterium]
MADLLRRSPVAPALRAQVWDIYEQAPDEDALAERLKSLNMPAQVKAQLWDMKYKSAPAPMAAAPQATPAPAAPSQPRTWVDETVDALPMVGGAIGGTVGAIGGTVAGVGVGGIPGAIGGATLGGALGESAKQLVNRARGATAPSSATEAALDIATEGGIQGVLEGVGGLATKGVAAVGSAVYRGYLKPALSGANIKKAREIVATGIRESLPITKFGEEKAARLISQLNGQVSAALSGSRGAVDLHQVAERVREFAQKRYFRPGAPPVDFTAVMKVADDIDGHPSLGLPAGAKPTRVNVSATQANETKQALDRAVGDTGFGVERTAATEARKVGRHAAREGIEKVAPEVGALNARESKLLDVIEAIQKASGREENKSWIYGMPTLMAAGIGGAQATSGNDPVGGLMTAVAARAMLSPAFASRAALLATRFAKVPGTAVADAVRMAAILTLREQENQNVANKKDQ